MAGKQGYIKLFRKIVDWEWYTEVNTCHLFIHMLIMSNHDTQKWRGEIVERGSFITSLVSLSNETGLSVRQVRTSIKNLVKTGDIEVKATNRNTKIIVLKYAFYQETTNGIDKHNDKLNDNQMSNVRQSNDNQTTTNKNVKNIKNVKNKEKKIYGEFENVKLTDDEYKKLGEKNLLHMIDTLSNYIASTGKSYKSHYATILVWAKKDLEKSIVVQHQRKDVLPF